MSITTLPLPPSRQDPANFALRADEFLGALPAFATEANDLASTVNTQAGIVSSVMSTYLGAKTSNPTLDNSGNALVSGAIYWNTSANEMRVWNGTAWLPIQTTSAATSAAQSAASAEQNRILTDSALAATLTALDNFDDRYLGTKTSNPTTDNDGNTLLDGAIYWNSLTSELRVWNGAAWNNAVSGVTSFNTRTGPINLTTQDVASVIVPSDINAVSKNGDTMSGTLTVPGLNTSNGISVTSGSLDFSSILQKITANFSGSVFQRLFFKDRSANTNTIVSAAPNGTPQFGGGYSSFTAYSRDNLAYSEDHATIDITAAHGNGASYSALTSSSYGTNLQTPLKLQVRQGGSDLNIVELGVTGETTFRSGPIKLRGNTKEVQYQGLVGSAPSDGGVLGGLRWFNEATGVVNTNTAAITVFQQGTNTSFGPGSRMVFGTKSTNSDIIENRLFINNNRSISMGADTPINDTSFGGGFQLNLGTNYSGGVLRFGSSTEQALKIGGEIFGSGGQVGQAAAAFINFNPGIESFTIGAGATSIANFYNTGSVGINGQITGKFAVVGTNVAAQDLARNHVSQVTISSSTTLTTTVAPAGTLATVIIVTSGITSATVTFGTGFKTVSTLATGAVSGRRFVFQFVSDGTNFIEASRTTAINY
jgi:hypothetical protein